MFVPTRAAAAALLLKENDVDDADNVEMGVVDGGVAAATRAQPVRGGDGW
jgi:hypothetical protein